MKTKSFFRLLGCLAILSGMLAFAQEDPRMWAADGVALRQGSQVLWQREAAMQEDGSVCVVWSDDRGAKRSVYAQMTDADGNTAWSEGGVLVAERLDIQQTPVILAVDGAWIIVWAEYDLVEPIGGDFCLVMAQKLNLSGQRLWGDGGVQIAAAGHELIEDGCLYVVSDLSGGALIAWLTDSWTGDIFAQRVSSEGAPLWAEEVQVAESAESFDATSDDQGNMLLGWIDRRDPQNPNIYGAKLMADGALPWGDETNGIPICVSQGRQNSIRICVDSPSAGMFCVWGDESNPVSYDLFMQKANGDGVIQWAENGVTLCDAPDLQRSPRITPCMNGDTQDGFIAVWEDQRVNGYTFEIYGQKVSDAGVALWAEDGIRICGNAATPTGGEARYTSWVSTDYSGGAVVSWRDYRDSDSFEQYYDFYASRVNAAGTNLWGECGTLVEGGDNAQGPGRIMVRPEESEVIVTYEDRASGSMNIAFRLLDMEDGSPLTELSTSVIEGLDYNARSPQAVSLGNGRVAVVWEDQRIGESVFFQIIDTTGETLFEAGGTPLAPDNETFLGYSQRTPAVCADGLGGFFTAFIDLRTGTKLVRLSHVNADGEIDCSNSGVVVWESGLDQQNAYVVADGEGGCYVAWSGYDMNYILEAYVMHMGTDCQRTWSEPIQLTVTPDMDDFVSGIIAGTSTSCIVTWTTVDYYNSENGIDAARILIDGTMDWSVSVCDADGERSDAAIISDGQGGALLAWADYRDMASSDNIYAQHLASNGTELWSHNGIPVYTGNGTQQRPRLVYSADNGLYIVWEDYRNNSDFDLYGQRIDAAGNLLWPASGLAISTEEDHQSQPQLLLNNLGGLTCVWSDSRAPYEDIYGADLLPDGATCHEWWIEGSGGAISTARLGQTNPIIAAMSDRSALIVWEDWRSSMVVRDEGGITEFPTSNLYMQRMITGGIPDASETPGMTPNSYALHQNYPNPFNPTTTISFSIAKAGTVSLVVYDLLGRSVTTLLNERLNSGSYQVPWDASALPSGMYFYRLKAGEFSDVKKTILLK